MSSEHAPKSAIVEENLLCSPDTWASGLVFFSEFAVEFAGCVWTVAVSGKKKLRIRKFPDTCERGQKNHDGDAEDTSVKNEFIFYLPILRYS